VGMNQHLGDRLKSRRKELKLTQQDVADAVNVSKTSVVFWERGENVPKHESLLLLAATLNTSPEWLLKGEGAVTMASGQPMIVTKEDHPNDFIWIDVVDISFSCGDGISIEYHYDEIKESLPFMPEFFVKKGVKPQNTKILVASGDSMENYIYDQDLFAIDVSDTDVKDGAIYAVYFENEAMLKQIFKEQGGTLVLHSLNPKYKDRDRHVHANNGDGFRVIGRQFWRSG